MDLYLAMADANKYNEPEARQLIKQLVPHLSGAVDSIIGSGGDPAAAKDAEASARTRVTSDLIRNQVRANRSGNVGADEGGNMDAESLDGSDVSGSIRRYVQSRRIGTEV